MRQSFTLEYWPDDDGYVGRLKEVPGVFSQGETLEDLESNIRDAYELVRADDEMERGRKQTQSKLIEVEV